MTGVGTGPCHSFGVESRTFENFSMAAASSFIAPRKACPSPDAKLFIAFACAASNSCLAMRVRRLFDFSNRARACSGLALTCRDSFEEPRFALRFGFGRLAILLEKRAAKAHGVLGCRDAVSLCLVSASATIIDAFCELCNIEQSGGLSMLTSVCPQLCDT